MVSSIKQTAKQIQNMSNIVQIIELSNYINVII